MLTLFSLVSSSLSCFESLFIPSMSLSFLAFFLIYWILLGLFAQLLVGAHTTYKCLHHCVNMTLLHPEMIKSLDTSASGAVPSSSPICDRMLTGSFLCVSSADNHNRCEFLSVIPCCAQRTCSMRSSLSSSSYIPSVSSSRCFLSPRKMTKVTHLVRILTDTYFQYFDWLWVSVFAKAESSSNLPIQK